MTVCVRALVNAQHGHVCVSVYLAFVTKHPRCQRDTVGCRRMGGWDRRCLRIVVRLFKLSLCVSDSRARGNLQQAGGERIQRALFTREQGLWGGRDGGSTCSPYVPEADDCWEVTGEEEGEGEGWRDACTLGLCFGGLSDDPASVNVHISVL